MGDSHQVTTAAKARLRVPIVVLVLLLLAVAVRMTHVVEFVEWQDEIRTVWRAQGSFSDLLARTPPDWPPLYGILTWGWARLAGGSLEPARMLSVLLGALGLALSYRAARALFAVTQPQHNSQQPALLSATVFAVAGYAIFAGVDVRAYGLLLALGALSLWLTVRYVRASSWRRAVPLAVSLALLFHTSYTSSAFIAYLTLFALVLRPRLWWRWLVIGIGVIVLALPVLPGFINNAFGRIGDVMPQPPPPFFEAMSRVYGDFGGGSMGWIVLFALAALVVVAHAITSRERVGGRSGLLLLVWVMFPALVYVVTFNDEFLKPRYMWWVLLGLTLLVGSAASRLPRPVVWVVVGAVLVLGTQPVDYWRYRLAETSAPPFRAVFGWLADNLRPGDVLIVDPHCTCGELYAWDYFVPQFFPTGYLPLVEHAADPDDQPRIWYLSNTGWERDESLLAQIEAGRQSSIFAGPWYFLVRLYEAPPHPLPGGVTFGESLRLHGVEIDGNNTVMAKNERFSARLWWSASAPLGDEYSVSLAVLDRFGNLVAQHDGTPQAPDTPAQLSSWEVDVYYDDYRTLQLPADIGDGDYRLVVTVYQWRDGQRLTPDGAGLFAVTADHYVELVEIRVRS